MYFELSWIGDDGPVDGFISLKGAKHCHICDTVPQKPDGTCSNHTRIFSVDYLLDNESRIVCWFGFLPRPTVAQKPIMVLCIN